MILVNLSNQSVKSWLAALREAGQPWNVEVVGSLLEAQALLQSQPHSHALICYDSPETHIANDIAKDWIPSLALVNWQSETESLLQLYRRYYERITLVTQQSLHSRSKELLDHLAYRSGIALGRVEVGDPALLQKPSFLDFQEQACWLMAVQALEQQSATRLVQELEASSLPLLEPEKRLALLDKVYETFNKEEKSRKDEVKCKDEECHQLKDKLEKAKNENVIVIEQLHTVQGELEKYLLDNRIVIQKKIPHGGAERELHRLKKSRSWRLTSPLRTFVQWLRGKKAWKNLAPLRKTIKSLLGRKKRTA